MILGSKFSLLSVPVAKALGFLTTLTSCPESASPPCPLWSLGPLPQGSSTQVTLSKLSVKPREMPTTTGPAGRSKERTMDSLIANQAARRCQPAPVRHWTPGFWSGGVTLADPGHRNPTNFTGQDGPRLDGARDPKKDLKKVRYGCKD